MLSPILRNRLLAAGLILLPLAILFIGFFSVPQPFALDDGLRHVVMAEHFREQGVRTTGWGDFFFTGYFTERNFDPWFLADMLYVPFTFVGEHVVALKLATFSFILILIVCFWLLLRTYRVTPIHQSIYILLLLFGSSTFFYRLFIGRPFVVMSGIYLLVVLALTQRKPWFLAPLLALSVLFSHLFVFPLAVSMAGVAWLVVRRERKHAVHACVAVLLGVICGFLLHPHPLLYIHYLFDIFLRVPFSKHVGLGGELYSGIWSADVPLIFVFAILMHMVIALIEQRSLHALLAERDELPFSFFLFVVFFCMYLVWNRAIDFLWPTCMLMLVQITSSHIFRQERVARSFWAAIPFLKGVRWQVIFSLFIVINATTVFVPQVIRAANRDLSWYRDLEALPPGSRIANLDWDLFPIALFVNDRLLFARGVDSSVDYYHDHEAFSLLSGRVNEWDDDGLAPDFNAETWVRAVRSYFSPDYIAIRTAWHPLLVDALEDVPAVRPLTGCGGALMLYTFRGE